MYKFCTKHFQKSVYELLILCIVIFCLVSFFMRTQAAYSAVKDGLLLCYHSVIPALFPFFIISKILLNSRFAFILGLPFLPYTKLVLKINSNKACTALLLGLTGGFGTGAVCLNSLYSSGQISKKQAEILLCAIINAGPAFVIACVGSTMLNSTLSGVLIYISLCCASLVCGLIAKVFMKSDSDKQSDVPNGKANCTKNADNANANVLATANNIEQKGTKNNSFVNIVNEAVISTLYLCGFVVFFSFVKGVFLPPNTNMPIKIAFTVLTEVISASELSAHSGYVYAVYLCCGALSFMGFSIFAQVRSLLNRKIKLTPLLLSRIIHLPVSLLSLYLCFKFLAPHIPVYSNFQAARMSMPLDAAFAVLFMCCSFFCVLHNH